MDREGTENPMSELYEAGLGLEGEPHEGCVRMTRQVETLKERSSLGARWFHDGSTAGISISDAMLELAHNFPTLRSFEGPWDAQRFEAWARSKSSGEKHAVRFVLSVWNPTTKWKVGRFDLHDAMGTWDPEHRTAFAAWAREPWWP